jgi:hypothetical protein
MRSWMDTLQEVAETCGHPDIIIINRIRRVPGSAALRTVSNRLQQGF